MPSDNIVKKSLNVNALEWVLQWPPRYHSSKPASQFAATFYDECFNEVINSSMTEVPIM